LGSTGSVETKRPPGCGSRLRAHEKLSDRELEVLLKLIAGGESLAQIAGTLHLNPNTVTTYRARICQKIALKSNAKLARYAWAPLVLLNRWSTATGF
jgi:DNA-binding NarL/FixJ family response regulator